MKRDFNNQPASDQKLGPPPSGALKKLVFYTDRYGLLHALARYLGTKQIAIWHLIGPLATRSYRKRWSQKSGGKVLNLGGGGNILGGCLTGDIDPRADCYVDLTRTLPFADSTIDAIFLEEVLEHLDQTNAFSLLRECLRILVPCGVIRVTTPDLDWLAKSILSGNIDSDYVNDIFYGHGHKYIYTRQSLRELLENVGFKNIGFTAYRDQSACLGALDSHADRFDHAPELSQYVEATKL